MTLGPLEYLVVGFEGNQFTGQILAELQSAREKGIIRVIDLLVLMKDENGNITVAELSDLSGEEAERLGPFAGDLHKVFGPDDVEAAANTLSSIRSEAVYTYSNTRCSLLPGRLHRQASHVNALLVRSCCRLLLWCRFHSHKHTRQTDQVVPALSLQPGDRMKALTRAKR